jgi:pimeloyl-ACP methyl ester carboxylesterase
VIIGKRKLKIIAAIFVIFSVIVVGISYYALSKLTFACDYTAYNKKMSQIAEEIRTELLKRPEIKQVSFTAEDGLKLSGLLITRTHATANLLVCHGYRCTKEFLYPFIEHFPHWNILLFDFRAHGQSEGTMTSIGCNEYRDIQAAARCLRAQIPTRFLNLPSILAGISMGAAASLKAVEIDPTLCDALIIDSSFAKLNPIMAHVCSSKMQLPRCIFFPVIKTLFEYMAHCDIGRMNLLESVKSIKQPIIFIHSCTDTFISPKNSIALYANAYNRKSQLWIGPACRHGRLYTNSGSLYREKITSFLKDVLPDAVQHTTT